jgi:hypothetical protein
MTDKTETTKRRRNVGVGGDNGPAPLPEAEHELVSLARRLAETDSLYAKRDALVVAMYDHGYTHKQLAELMNDSASTDLTYDAVGRIIRNARRAGVQV